LARAEVTARPTPHPRLRRSQGSGSTCRYWAAAWWAWRQTPAGFSGGYNRAINEVARFKPLTADGPAWASPVIHNRRLYPRQNDLLACHDLSAQP